MRYNNVEINVLIKGKAITEYPHNGSTFVEGRAGSEFELELRNHNNFRVEAIVSVDGLSVIDGKDANANSAGYLIEANETIRIPGWKLNEAQVAAFQFAGKGQSYATAMTGSARNNGVIGVIAFAEKYQRPVYTAQPYMARSFTAKGADFYPTSGGFVPMGSSAVSDSLGGMSWNASSADYGAEVVAMAAAPASLNMLASMDAQATKRAYTKSMEPKAEAVTQQNLGTGFGKAQDFATTTVQFERGDMHAMLVMYYDDNRGLKARGIDLSRRNKRRDTQLPNPFPGMNCAPPPGWNG